MNPSKAILGAGVVLLFGAASLLSDTKIDTPPSLERDTMIEESFAVSPGDDLIIDTDDANIIVQTATTNEAHVKVELTARDMDRAQRYFESLDFEVVKSGDRILVTSDRKTRNFSSWKSTGGANIVVEVSVPTEFNVDLKTSDGDISLDDLTGEASLKSSDGDLRIGALEGSSLVLKTSDGDILANRLLSNRLEITTSDGDIKVDDVLAESSAIRTSDGSIQIELISGETSLKTADGDIMVRGMDSPSAELRTSDGDIAVDRFSGDQLNLRTADGNITASQVSGGISATTSDGDVRIEIEEMFETYARASDGNVYIVIPSSARLDVQMRGEQVKIDRGLQFDGTIRKRSAEGTINGGGISLQASTSDGHVILSHQ